LLVYGAKQNIFGFLAENAVLTLQGSRSAALIMLGKPPEGELTMRSSGIGKRSKRSKYLERRGKAEELIVAYVELDLPMKEFFEQFLALQVYSEGGMQSYLPSSAGSEEETRPCSAEDGPSLYVFETWFDWAQEIKGAPLNHFERREAVRAMLGALIRLKDRRVLGALELREAAKGTLDWTRWEVRYLAKLGLN
jgi:hypothetical protein